MSESAHDAKDMASFVDRHREAILQSCAYKRRDFDLITIRTRPHEMKPVEESLRTYEMEAYPSQNDEEDEVDCTPSSLGKLDRLPFEVQGMVLEQLDVQSYFRFRKVNRRARLVATHAVRAYAFIAEHALEAYRALLRSHLAYRVPLLDLYGHLTAPSADCACCGKFGGFLFLLTMKRCCFSCLERGHPQVQSVQLSAMATAAKLKTSRLCQLLDMPVPSDAYRAKNGGDACTLASVPMLRTVPGWYSMEKPEGPPEDASKQAQQQSLRSWKRRPSSPPPSPYVHNSNCPHQPASEWQPKYVIAVEAAVATLAAQGVELDTKAAPLVHAREWNRAYMAAAALPWIDLAGRPRGQTTPHKAHVEHGLSCKGCQLWYESGYGCQFCSHLSRQQTYSEKAFLEHFATCNQAHWAWEESEQGQTQLAQESAFLQRGGTFPLCGVDGLEL